MWLALLFAATGASGDLSNQVTLDPPNVLSGVAKNRLGFGIGLLPASANTSALVTAEANYELRLGKRYIVGLGAKLVSSPVQVSRAEGKVFQITPLTASIDAILYEASWGRFLAGGDVFLPTFVRHTRYDSLGGEHQFDELWVGTEGRVQQVFRLWRGGEAAVTIPLQVHLASAATTRAAVIAIGGRVEIRQRLNIAVLFARVETMFRWSSDHASTALGSGGEQWTPFDLTPITGSIWRPAMTLGVKIDL
jgi:hypothetical protein